MPRSSGRSAFTYAACLLCVLWTVAGVAGATTASATPIAPATTDDPGPGDDVRIDGTVTGVDGEPAADAAVIVGESGTLRELSTDGLRALAAADPPNVTVVRVGDDGGFAATVDWDRADAAVAVSDRGVSELRILGHENATLALRLHERRPQTVFAHLGSIGQGERRGDLYLSLVNNDGTAVRTLSVRVTSLPEGWSIAAVRGDGRFHPTNRTIEWSSVAPGEEIDTTVVVATPPTPSPGAYAVGLRAASATHPVAIENETVEVRPAETPGPTTAPLRTGGTDTTGAAGRGSATGDESSTETARASGRSGTADATGTNATGDGLGIATAVVGAAAAVLLGVALGRGRRR
ncbi:NEW3 domain-containing protein [Halobaculum rubrum]|uniref:NEW3 domain-containing protein n=1 Tax=Halobaculum rubrum TaxID=2872158 RepID=UPI001CA436EE|nr:NEW3 domain-containing protein [Halobaculum rubrum]QZY00661.1 hypothetical protein K6T25_06170 [Halobaculum rubrum]